MRDLVARIRNEDLMSIAYVTSSLHDMLARPELPKCDVLVMDPEMPHAGGLEGIRLILERFSSVRILVYTTSRKRDLVRGCLDAGVRGYVLKQDPPETLARAIRDVVAGKVAVSPAVE